jgi:DNA primase
VAGLPGGLDPDEIVARDSAEWQAIIASAKPIVTHVMDTLAVDKDLKDPKIKNQIAAQVLPLIADLPNPVERDTYRQQLARLLRVDERALTESAAPSARPRRTRAKPVQPTQSNLPVFANPSMKIEGFCLGLLYRKPELLFRLDRALQEIGLASISPEDFEYTDHQLLFSLLRQAVEQDEQDHLDYLSSQIPQTLGPLAQELINQTKGLDPVDGKNLEELIRSVIKLRKLLMNENLNQLRFLQEEAQQGGDLRAASYADLVLQHTRLLRDLDQANQMIYVKRVG